MLLAAATSRGRTLHIIIDLCSQRGAHTVSLIKHSYFYTSLWSNNCILSPFLSRYFLKFKVKDAHRRINRDKYQRNASVMLHECLRYCKATTGHRWIIPASKFKPRGKELIYTMDFIQWPFLMQNMVLCQPGCICAVWFMTMLNNVFTICQGATICHCNVIMWSNEV